MELAGETSVEIDSETYLIKLIHYLKSEKGKIFIKYAASSFITTVMTVVITFVTYDFMRIGSARLCNLIASVISIPPSYWLNRKWAWGKSGRGHLFREVIPFWVIALSGLAISTFAVAYAAKLGQHLTKSRHIVTLFVSATNLATYGVLWILRFFLLNKYLFKEHPEVLKIGGSDE
jgi:putative flippase GtrA